MMRWGFSFFCLALIAVSCSRQLDRTDSFEKSAADVTSRQDTSFVYPDISVNKMDALRIAKAEMLRQRMDECGVIELSISDTVYTWDRIIIPSINMIYAPRDKLQNLLKGRRVWVAYVRAKYTAVGCDLVILIDSSNGNILLSAPGK